MNRKILISGSSRGIGYSIAKQVLNDGHRISLGMRNPNDIDGTDLDPKKSVNGSIFVNKYDALDQTSAKDWVKDTVKYFGGIDTIIHCAGIFYDTGLLFEDNDLEKIEELWKVNVLAPWILTKESWSYIEESNNGRIIILVSMSGKRSKGNLAGYTASKFALMGLSQTIRNQGWDKGIRVTAICPGWVNTDMAQKINSISHNEMTQPEDIALICSNLLRLPNSAIPFDISLNCNLEK